VLVRGRTDGRPRRRLRDRARFLGARLVVALPPRVQVRLAGGSPIVVDGQTLHPELQVLLHMRERMGVKGMSDSTPEAARRQSRAEARAFAGPAVEVGAVAALEVPSPDGPLPARHYAPDEIGAPHPLLVWFHGGGFVVGDLDIYDQACRTLCRHAGVHVLAVEYRLAPEHPFPAAVDDAAAALDWAHEHAAELGADPDRVLVGGDSAGGNLAAVVAREASTRPLAQLLIYPAVDTADRRHPSHELFAEGFFLTAADCTWFHGHYLGATPPDDPRARPLGDHELAGLPPAIVVTAAFDPLRDEGEAYAAALRAAGVPTLLRRFPGLVHGFINMTGVSPASRDALVEIAGALRVLARRETSPERCRR
jgi:acetyl esterase